MLHLKSGSGGYRGVLGMGCRDAINSFRPTTARQGAAAVYKVACSVCVFSRKIINLFIVFASHDATASGIISVVPAMAVAAVLSRAFCFDRKL